MFVGNVTDADDTSFPNDANPGPSNAKLPSCWPVEKKTPPSRFHTVFFDDLDVVFSGGSGFAERSSIRDCGGLAPELGIASWANAAEIQRSPLYDANLADSANISLAQSLSLPRAEDCAYEKRFRQPDKWLDRR